MSPTLRRRLFALHRIAGVLVLLNVVLLAGTGLVLVFHEEIDALVDGPAPPPTTARASLVDVASRAASLSPGSEPRFFSIDDNDDRRLFVTSFPAGHRGLEGGKTVVFDAATGEPREGGALDERFTGQVLRLHADLFLGSGGSLLVGVVGLAYAFVLTTGFFLYGPFARGRGFGERRASAKGGLADIHKLIAACVWGWNVVVVVTGILLALVGAMLRLWSATELAEMTKGDAERPVPAVVVSLDRARSAAEAAAPDKRFASIIVPGTPLSGNHHFALLMRGKEGLDARIFEILLVDAETGALAARRELPWYLRAALVAEPLHFGDYGGLPLKVVWVAFTLATLGMALTGAASLIVRRRRRAVDEPAPALEAA